MTKVKPGLPQGTRDFGPEVVRKRQYILDTIRQVFELYGFQPLETPALENLETLTGKYGEEGDKLIFKILNNGLDNPAKESQVRAGFEKVLAGKNNAGITERALKYDLTIPFARYVAMNHAKLVMPFKRYQVQPVWRADRPQKGRYREFYQCDADVVGSASLLNEVELAHIYDRVFVQLGMKGYDLRINSRKMLTGLAQVAGLPEGLTDITVAIDKLDKIGLEKVKEELAGKGLRGEQIELIEQYLGVSGTNEEKLHQIRLLLGENEDVIKGLEEIAYLLRFAGDTRITVDFTLARGLNYYTGIIFEVKAPEEVRIGSIGGGGRYDDLTGLFGLPGIPGVGISFGVDRIYDVLEEMQLFPAEVFRGTQVLFLHLGEQASLASFSCMQQLRDKGIRAELYHVNNKIDKQYKYAEGKNIPFVVSIGEDDIGTRTCKIKNIRTGTQEVIFQEELFNYSFI